MREDNLLGKFKKSQDFGNSLRDTIIENQLQNEVGSELELNGDKLKLKSKSGKVLGGEIPLPSGGGSDDFIKKILSYEPNTLVDMGYNDSVTGHRVYGIRRVYDFDPEISNDPIESNPRFYIIFLEHISKIYSIQGSHTRTSNISYGKTTSIHNNNSMQFIVDVNGNLCCEISSGFELNRLVEAGVFDFIVIFSSDQETIESVNEIYYTSSINDCKPIIIYGNGKFKIVDSSGNKVTNYYYTLIPGEYYTIESFDPEPGYKPYRYSFHKGYGGDIVLPYTFECESGFTDYDVTAYTYKEDAPMSLEFDQTNALITCYDENGSIVSPGDESVINGKDYHFNVEFPEGYDYGYIYLYTAYDSLLIQQNQLPYTFTCINGVVISAQGQSNNT